jgi:uncharacterized membrane protein
MNQFTASLWGDEGFAAVLAQKPIEQIIKIVAHDTSPPLYYLCLHAWMKIFGNSEVAIRVLSFLFFLGLCFVVFLIAKHLFDQKTGILAGILAFFNPFLFYYGFEGRMYSILALTSTLSVYFYLKKKWGGWIFATIAALYSHHFALLVIFVEGIWSLVDFLKHKNFSIKNILRNFWPFLVVFIFYVPWFYPLYYQTMLVESGFWLGKPVLSDIFVLIKSFLAGSIKVAEVGWILLVSLILLAIRRWKANKTDIFLLVWFGAPIILVFLVSQIGSSIFFDRYMLAMIPPLLILVVSSRRKFVSWGLILVLFLLLMRIDYYYFWNPTKRPFRDLASYVKGEIGLEVRLMNFNAKAHHLWETKYYGLEAPLYVPAGELPFFVGTALMKEDDIIREVPRAKKVGVITSGSVEEVLLEGYSLKNVVSFGELKVLWFIRNPLNSLYY